MRRRVLLIAVLIIALALAVPTAAIYFLAFTQSGLHFIVNRIPARIAGVQLDLTLFHLHVANGGEDGGRAIGRTADVLHHVIEHLCGFGLGDELADGPQSLLSGSGLADDIHVVFTFEQRLQPQQSNQI